MEAYKIGKIVYTLRDYHITEVIKCKILSITTSSKGIFYDLYDLDRDKKYDIKKRHDEIFETRLKAQHHLSVSNLSGYYAQKKMIKHINKQNKVNSEPEIVADWWKYKSNFPCILIANFDSEVSALVWVHYQIDGIAYDVRDNGYRLIKHTNWRRATKQEIMDNIKGH